MTYFTKSPSLDLEMARGLIKESLASGNLLKALRMVGVRTDNLGTQLVAEKGHFQRLINEIGTSVKNTKDIAEKGIDDLKDQIKALKDARDKALNDLADQKTTAQEELAEIKKSQLLSN